MIRRVIMFFALLLTAALMVSCDSDSNDNAALCAPLCDYAGTCVGFTPGTADHTDCVTECQEDPAMAPAIQQCKDTTDNCGAFLMCTFAAMPEEDQALDVTVSLEAPDTMSSD